MEELFLFVLLSKTGIGVCCPVFKRETGLRPVCTSEKALCYYSV